MAFLPNICVLLKNNPQNIKYMPVVTILAFLELNQIFSFVDGH